MKLDPTLPLLWALDFNVDPMSSLIVQKEKEEIRVLDEIVLSRASTQDACEEFHTRFPNHQAGIVIYGDSTGDRRQTCGMSDYKVIQEFLIRNGYKHHQFQVPAQNPLVRERLALVNGQLLSKYESVQLFVDPRCKELVKDFEEVTYKPDSGVIDKEKDSKRTHLSDAIGYLVWQECNPQTLYGEQGTRLF